MEVREVGCGGINWSDLVQDRDRDRWRAVVNEKIILGV
jgi:hypothetical protein